MSNKNHQRIYNETFDFYVKQLKGCDFWFILFVLEDVARYKARKAKTQREIKQWQDAAAHLRIARINIHI